MRVNERADNVSVDEIEVADPADAWIGAGFSVDSDAVCRVGGVASGWLAVAAAPGSSGGRCAACRRTARSMMSMASRRRDQTRSP